ncbi:MAG TPA: malto-oligosyltrehalose trehalohydrolase [Acidimicrobiales bacterium]|nr:malto-oligosyltrehalose trehalohydrolase [Acidimicrobiales bacterium]
MSLWAPRAAAVLIDLDDGVSHPMECDGDGWWRIDLQSAGRYRYVVDGFAMADPCSPWQPDGVDGWSHTVDHEAFDWHDDSWTGRPISAAVIYELHIGTFTSEGTFDGAIDHLDHLVELGVNAVELMPVAEFSGNRGWGYDGVLLYAPHHAYGGPDGLKRLVDACHARGLSVVLDVVYNHLGPHGNHLDRCGPYLSEQYRTQWGPAVNLDGPDSDIVRQFFSENAMMWVRDYHIDGLRVDAVHAFADLSALPFLEQLTAYAHDATERLGRPIWMIAESDLNDPRVVRTRDQHGFGFDASWSDDFHHALHAVVTGERSGYYADFGLLGQLAVALRQAYVYDGRYSPHRRRTHGRSPSGVATDRFLAYAQTHDQVGNRAHGERLSALVSTRALEMAAAVVLLSPFVPMLFQGEEWGASSPFLYFTDHADPTLGDAVREGRRSEFASFGWDPASIPDPQAAESFLRSKLDWSEIRRSPHSELLAWHRQLVALRSAVASDDGLLPRDLHVDEGHKCLAVRCDRLTWALNFSGEGQRVGAQVARDNLILANDAAISVERGQVSMPPQSVAIFRSN